jgi:hypothetical protein
MEKIREVLVALTAILGLGSSASAQERIPFAFEAVTPPAGASMARFEALAEATRFASWPRGSELAVAPEASRSLLARPQLASRETVQYAAVELAGEAWGQVRVSWQDLSSPQTPEPPSPAAREKELRRLGEAQRADRTTADGYLARRLERQRAVTGRRLDGELTVELALSPSARAAQELLLARMAENMLPVDALASAYRGASAPDGLGDRAWLSESRTRREVRIDLVRRNVALTVTARGTLAEEALGLARRLDGLVERQPSRTLEELRALRPAVSLAARPAGGALGFSVALPEGARAGGVTALVDGQRVRPRDGTIPMAGKARVRVTAVTRELLAGSAESVVGGP